MADHGLLGWIFRVTKEMKMSISPCFHPAVTVLLRARVHHSSLPGITQILPHANQNRQGKKGCFMTDLVSTRGEGYGHKVHPERETEVLQYPIT